MDVFETLSSNIVAFVILVFLLLRVNHRLDTFLYANRLYRGMILCNMVIMAVDTLGWFLLGKTGGAMWMLNTVVDGFVIGFEPLIILFWVLYVDYQVNHDEMRIRRIKLVLVVLFLLNFAVTALSPLTHWFYFVDAQSIYHRGNIHTLHVLFCFLLILYSMLYVVLRRKKLEKRYYRALLIFNVPVLVGALVQTLHYGVSYTWSGLTLSLLIVYFDIQDRSMNTDYLTGFFNRRQLDRIMKSKILSAVEGKPFSAILLDIDRFKSINDTYGHLVGDEALRDAVDIIRQCIRRNDFAARFGGDEFFILLDISDRHQLAQRVECIRRAAERFNKTKAKPFRISFSIGYDVYDVLSATTANEFIWHIDRLMYLDKMTKAHMAMGSKK